MKTFLKLLVVVPLVLIAVAFAFANRQGTVVSFDPFASDVPAFALSGPLFVVLLVTVVFGVLLGGVAAWLGQGRYRRVARAERRENEALRAEVARLRADLATAGQAARNDNGTLPMLPGRSAA